MALSMRVGFVRNDAELGASGQPELGMSSSWTAPSVLKNGFQRRREAVDADERLTIQNIASLAGTYWRNGFLRMVVDDSLCVVQDAPAARMWHGFLRSTDPATLGALSYSLAPQPTATEQAGFLRTPRGDLVAG